MKKKFLVRCIEGCLECHGTGHITNPHGECPTCEGAGKLSYWMPLQDALQELGSTLPYDWEDQQDRWGRLQSA